MNALVKETEFDVIIVGSGTCGATLARELSKKNKKVLILEQGDDVSLRETFSGVAKVVNKVVVGNKLDALRAITVGGSTAVYAAKAELPPLEKFKALGIDLSAELNEVQKELPIAPLPDRLLGPQAIRLRESALALGYPWKNHLMLVDQSKCESGYSYEAKWKAKSFLEEAIKNGVTLITRATVNRIVIDKNKAVGVEYKFNNKSTGIGSHIVYGKKIVLAAGVLASPKILLDSGIENIGKNGFYCEPAFALFGIIPGLNAQDNYGGCMDTYIGDGIHVGDTNLPRTFYRLFMLGNLRLGRLFSFSNSIAIGGRIADEAGGEMQKDGRYIKPLAKEDSIKLKKAEEVAMKILKHTGAKNIFHGGFMASHVGGLLKINEHVDASLQMEITNLYVCDGSVIPENVREAPAVTLVCLAKYLAKHLVKQLSPSVESIKSIEDVETLETVE